ncbi:hypothetical protein G6L37_03395 [Agrobacterium rubi]|nr:hypothetical protein [Agrobacterium rubi]NTF24416.1 hypothetical protein [Agrobacterium rubi]
MNPSRSIAVALALVSAGMLCGCQTASTTQTAENRVRMNSGAYKGESSALGGDIKTILMAGGLDVANPMAPTGDTNRSEIAKSRPPEYNTDTMVAALSDTTTRTASAAQTAKPSSATVIASVSQPEKPVTALAMVAVPRPAPQKKILLETRIEDDKVAPIELASVNMSSSSDDAFDPIPEQKSTPVATTAPVAVAAKESTPDPVATSPTSASAKTSRVRRF